MVVMLVELTARVRLRLSLRGCGSLRCWHEGRLETLEVRVRQRGGDEPGLEYARRGEDAVVQQLVEEGRVAEGLRGLHLLEVGALAVRETHGEHRPSALDVVLHGLAVQRLGDRADPALG